MSELPWHMVDLGISSLHSRSKGAGIRVALLDSGVAEGDGVFGNLRSITPDGSATENIDDDGHGSACASLIASRDENAPGIAPDVELVSIKVTASGAPIERLVREGLRSAGRLGCHVISCSLTLAEAEDQTLDVVREICNQGIVVVAAAGNDPSTPSAFPERTPNILVVGPYGHDRELLESRVGAFVDIHAPGVDLPILASDGSRRVFGQSSGAAALVSGIMALVLASTRDLGTARVGLALEGLAKSTAHVSDGARLIAPHRLLNAAQSLP